MTENPSSESQTRQGAIPVAGTCRTTAPNKTPAMILVIEDEAVMREACFDVLAAEGYRVELAADGTIGIERARALLPDLVLVDIRMPGIDGLEVIEVISKIDPDIIMIVITGYATIEYAVQSMKNGAYDFLPKPFTPDELRLIVRRGLERRRLIAERAALQAEKKRMTDFFISIVSHQLKSPLSAVKQYFEVILGDMAGPVSPETRDILVRADHRMDELISLIDDWLSFSRFDPARAKTAFKPLDIPAILKHHLEFLSPLIKERGVRVSVSIDSPTPVILGDKRSLGEIFANLIANGVKYNRQGGGLTVSVVREGAECVISFADTGVGIPEKDVPLIFTEFFRSKSPETMDIPGTGMGLAIVKKIVEAHDGTVGFETRYGKGSTFTVRLPVATP